MGPSHHNFQCTLSGNSVGKNVHCCIECVQSDQEYIVVRNLAFGRISQTKRMSLSYAEPTFSGLGFLPKPKDSGRYACEVPGKFLGIGGQDPCDSRFNRLHVDIFRYFFHSCKVYFIDSSKMIGKFPEDLMNFNRFCLELKRFICN